MKFSRFLVFAIAGTSLGALAQAPVAYAPPSTPLKMQYQSAFADYRPYAEVEAISWKQANDDAAAVGGPLGQMARDTVPGAVAKPGAVPAMSTKPATTPVPANPATPAAPTGPTGQPR